MKPVTFLGDSLEALREFSRMARREAGLQLDRVRRGLIPDDWKPMKTMGPGVNEIRVRDTHGAFRVLYVANLADGYTCCMHSRKRPSEPPKPIWMWRQRATKR